MKEMKNLMRFTAACASFCVGAIVASHIGLWRATKAIDKNIKEAQYTYEDISDSWYDNLAYIGYNTGFEEYEYIIYWYEGDAAYYQGFSTPLEPSDAIRYIEERPYLWLGKGLSVS